MILRFGECELNVEGRELRRAGELHHLEPQAFDLLVLLVERRAEVVSKHDLLDGVWGHRFLSEANLTTRIKEIRRAVGDDGATQHTIRNVRGRGYRFVATIHEAAEVRPSTTPALIGRDGQVAAVVDRLRPCHVVTLAGPGGVGKSTLARAIAHAVHGRLPDGVHVVELSRVAVGDDVVPVIARTLDIVGELDRPDAIARPLAGLDALVILDNCEHVADEVAGFVDLLLGSPDCRVRLLATSRLRLGIGTEEVVPLAPLPLDDGVELFRVRATAARPDWQPADAADERVRSLVDGLDRLPLCIEMAAARLGSLSFDELETLLSQGTPMLQLTHRSPTRRHRSLESLVAWSADLLDDDDRRLFAELAVFAGPVGADDIGAVLGRPSGDVALRLVALAESSLLAADAGGASTRYRMLDTVRTVATRWLDSSGRADVVRQAHAHHLAAVTDRIDDDMRTTAQPKARLRLDQLVAEVRSAHRWMRANDPELAARQSAALHLPAYFGLWNEPFEWSRVLLAEHPDAADDELLGARLSVAAHAAHRGALPEARDLLAPVIAHGGDRLLATAVEVLADVAIYAGDIDEVLELTSLLATMGAELGDHHCRAIAIVNRGIVLAYSGRDGAIAEGLALLDHAAPDPIAPSDRAWLAYTRGELLASSGHGDAITAFVDASRLGAASGDRLVVSVARVSLGSAHTRAGRYDEARSTFADCLRDHLRHGNLVHAVTALRNVVELLVAIGDHDAAAHVVGALTNDDRRPAYGAELLRFERTLEQLESRLGAASLQQRLAQGADDDLEGTLRYAVGRLDGIG